MTKLTDDNIFQIEGWLRVCDNFSPGTLQTGRNSTAQQSIRPEWIPIYCIINRKTKKFHHFPSAESAEEYKRLSEPCIPPSQCLKIGGDNLQKDFLTTNTAGIRLNSSTKSFTLDNKGSPLNFSNENDTSSGRKGNIADKNRGSSASINSDDAGSKPQCNQSKFSGFFSRKSKQFKNIKRTKSATKLDRKKDSEGPLSIYECDSIAPVNGRNLQSNVVLDSTCDFPETNLKRSASLGRLSKRIFSRANFGQKSFDKKDKINVSSEKIFPVVPQLRPSHSSEVLFTPRISANGKNLLNLDFSNDSGFSARSLHLSLSSEPCFIINQPVTPFGSILNGNGSEEGKMVAGQGKEVSKVFNDGDSNQTVVCYACVNEEEKCLWLRWLWIFKDCNEKCRTQNSLKLFILEAKNLPPKKRYFCEISLNKQLYARTTVKQMSDILFWGEQFSFNDLSKIDKIDISIYREAERKKKKEKHFHLGTLSIPTSEISTRQLNERWYSATIPAPQSIRSSLQRPISINSGKEAEMILIRVKARFQSVNILPIHIYQPLLDCLRTDYGPIVEALEPIVGVKAKEELATCIVSLLHHTGDVNKFLSDVVMSEVEKQENDTLALRGNSIATKAIESYMVLIGQQYLISTLQNILWSIISSGVDCEVDPSKVQNSLTLQNNRLSLIQNCQTVWYKICNSSTTFPVELKKLFMTIREHYTTKLNQSNKSYVHSKNQSKSVRWDQLISSCVFLRFFCPAILSPSLFNIVQSFPDEKSNRNLTLIAKTIQGLANFTKFGGKESFMGFMNDFVLREFSEMTKFLENISMVNAFQSSSFRLENDSGRELAVLHSLLVELFKDMSEPQKSKIPQLVTAIQDISKVLSNPSLLAQTQKHSAYPNTPPPFPSGIRNNISPLSIHHESHILPTDHIINLSTEGAEPKKRTTPQIPHSVNGVYQRHASTDNFISTTSTPTLTKYNGDSRNKPIEKYISSSNSKYMNADKLSVGPEQQQNQQRCISDIFSGFDELTVDEQWKRIVACAESSKDAANLPLVDFSTPGKLNMQLTTSNASSAERLNNKTFFTSPSLDDSKTSSTVGVAKILDWTKINVDSNRNVGGGGGGGVNAQCLNGGSADVNRNYNAAEMWQRNELRKAETRSHNSAYERLMKMQKANSVESLDVPIRQTFQHYNYPRAPIRFNADPNLKLMPISNSLQHTRQGNHIMAHSAIGGLNSSEPTNGQSNNMVQSEIGPAAFQSSNRNASSPQFGSLPPPNNKSYNSINYERPNISAYNSMQNIRQQQKSEPKMDIQLSKQSLYQEQLKNNRVLYEDSDRRSSSPSLTLHPSKFHPSISQPTLYWKPALVNHHDMHLNKERPFVSSQPTIFKEKRSVEMSQPKKKKVPTATLR